MKQIAAISVLIAIFLMNCPVFAIEQAPRISDREIVERLAKIEEQNKHTIEDIKQLREDIKVIREDMNNQFNRLTQIMLGMVGAFVAIAGGTISFAIWDRRTMVRPFEDKVKKIDDDIADNRSRLNSLVDALRELSKTDKKVAEILSRFNLL